jgi:hypothetical protein
MAVIMFSSVLSWLSFFLVINRLDPFANTATALVSYYITLFLALTGTFTIIGFYIRLWWLKNSLYYHNINISFRQGFLVALGVCAMLGFQSLRILNWWDGIIIVIIVTIIEFSFLSNRLK